VVVSLRQAVCASLLVRGYAGRMWDVSAVWICAPVSDIAQPYRRVFGLVRTSRIAGMHAA
jgi:hypothetical protein